MGNGITRNAMLANFSVLNRIWSEGFIGSLTTLRKLFGNDMDKIVVLAVISQGALRAGSRNRRLDDVMAGPAITMSEKDYTNVQSIADSTGIPRESVRRKVNELIELGWVERMEGNLLRVTRKAGPGMGEAAMTNLDIIDDVVTKLLAELEAMGLIKVLYEK